MALAPAAPAAPAATEYVKDEPPGLIKRDRWKRPLIKQADGTEKGYTRASGLGKVLEFQGNLIKRDQRIILHTVVRDRELMLTAQSIESYDANKADKDALDQVIGKALDRGGAFAKAAEGTALHAFGDQIDQGKAIPGTVAEDVARFLEAYRAAMAPFRVLLSETFVVHDEYQAAGTFDRLVELLVPMQPVDRKGRPVGPVLPAGTVLVLDLKTSQTSDYFGAKFAIQQAVYAHGCLYDPATGARTDHGANSRWALILHLPSGGVSPMLHWVDLGVGAALAEIAIEAKGADSRGKAAIAAASPEPLDSLHQAISGARAPAALFALHAATGAQWTEAHAQHASDRLAILQAREAAAAPAEAAQGCPSCSIADCAGCAVAS
jgi:hypothetical protein